MAWEIIGTDHLRPPGVVVTVYTTGTSCAACAATKRHLQRIELARVAMGARTDDEWRYFCGCCWRRIKQAQEHAAMIVASTDEMEDDG